MPALIDPAERRQELLSAAWRIALDEGVGATTVRRVAAVAQRSPSAVQRAFPTQDALHRSLAIEVVRRNRGNIFAVREERPVDSVMALLPTTSARREVVMLGSQMEHSSHVFTEYPLAAAQFRANVRAFCEHQFRRNTGLPITADLTGIWAMAMMRFQVVFDGLCTRLIQDLASADGLTGLTPVRGLVLQSLTPSFT